MGENIEFWQILEKKSNILDKKEQKKKLMSFFVDTEEMKKAYQSFCEVTANYLISIHVLII